MPRLLLCPAGFPILIALRNAVKRTHLRSVEGNVQLGGVILEKTKTPALTDYSKYRIGFIDPDS